MVIYEYAGCSTCRRAIKFLENRGVKFERRPIVERPPTPAELKRMLEFLRARGQDLKNLFNTSGERYRALKVADQLKAGLTEAAALKLLALDGKLIKRPFLLTKDDGAVGFDEALWTQLVR